MLYTTVQSEKTDLCPLHERECAAEKLWGKHLLPETRTGAPGDPTTEMQKIDWFGAKPGEWASNASSTIKVDIRQFFVK